jgi:hypothetical protein
MARKFQKKPVIVEAIQWKGGDYKILDEFCGRNWGRADAVGQEVWPSEISDAEQVMVFNTAEQSWLPVPVGHWIVRGIQGELYPCKPDIFEATYQWVP